MTVIWKYVLDGIVMQKVQMPKGARILAVAAQFEKPCLWAAVDPTAAMEDRTICMAATGHSFAAEADTELEYIGTYQLAGGTFVGHVFEAGDVDRPASRGAKP